MAAGTSATPTVSGSRLFVASNDDNLYALDLTTGKLLWKKMTGNQLMTAPLVYHGMVFFGQGDMTAIYSNYTNPLAVGGGISADYGADAATGKVVWYQQLLGTGMPSAAIVGGMYIRHDGGGFLTAIDAASGNFRWRTYVESFAGMSAVNVVNATEAVSSGSAPSAVIAFRPQDGKVLWTHRFGSSVTALSDCPVATDGRRIYGMYLAATANQDTFVQHVYALDAKNGKLLWDGAFDKGTPPERNAVAIPLVHGNVLYIGSSLEGHVHALNAATGKSLWQARTHGTVQGGLVLKDGVLYYGDKGGYLAALDAKSGSTIGAQAMPGAAFRVGSPIIVGETLVIGDNAGNVYAVPLSKIKGSHA